MLLRPVKERQLELCHPLKHFRIVLTLSHFGFHVLTDLWDPCISGMLFIAYEQVKFGVFFNFHAKLIKSFDRCITCEEVLRTRSESDDFQIFYANDRSCNRNEIRDHLRDILSSAYRIFRNISLEMSHAEIV